MDYIINNNFSAICYHWNNGAFINGYHYDFEEDLAKLISQFGLPVKIVKSIINE